MHYLQLLWWTDLEFSILQFHVVTDSQCQKMIIQLEISLMRCVHYVILTNIHDAGENEEVQRIEREQLQTSPSTDYLDSQPHSSQSNVAKGNDQNEERLVSDEDSQKSLSASSQCESSSETGGTNGTPTTSSQGIAAASIEHQPEDEEDDHERTGLLARQKSRYGTGERYDESSAEHNDEGVLLDKSCNNNQRLEAEKANLELALLNTKKTLEDEIRKLEATTSSKERMEGDKSKLRIDIGVLSGKVEYLETELAKSKERCDGLRSDFHKLDSDNRILIEKNPEQINSSRDKITKCQKERKSTWFNRRSKRTTHAYGKEKKNLTGTYTCI